MPHLSHIVAALAVAAALTLPAAATAQGGGGTTLSDAPCASILYKGPTGSVQNKGPITLSYNVTSCYVGVEDVVVTIDNTFFSDRPDAGSCTWTGSWTAIQLQLKPGDTKGFSTTAPPGLVSNPCPIGTTMTETYVASVWNAADGALLAQTTNSFALTQRF